ncbi:MAG: electron transport complex subunit RsxC [Candidatus Omnitrophota bacterium]|jgi:electron transport complex protein RnfC
MVKLKEHKKETENKAIERLLLPSRVYIPLSQHLGKPCLPEVKAGDIVSAGQRIAAVEAHVYAPIHASISGKVVSVQDWPHPVSGRCKAIVIDGDGKDSRNYSGSRTQEEVDKLTPDEVRRIVREAGIVGMGGASFPTHIKLNPPRPVDTLIVNGAECEPYLTGDNRLMLENTDKIIMGIRILVKCLGIKSVYIAIEENKPEAINEFRGKAAQYTVKVLRSVYPQGGEKQLIKNVLQKEVPSGKLPFDVGVMVHNVGTIFAIYEAVYFNKPLYERVVTVTGSCVSNPKNIMVPIGTLISELIDFCGPLKGEPAKIIIGGPMMGIAQYTDKVPVIKSTTGVILMGEKQIKVPEEEFCIRCGACVRECPAGLMPCMISLASERNNRELVEAYNVSDCIECGLCAYVCPAKRDMVQHMKYAKSILAGAK